MKIGFIGLGKLGLPCAEVMAIQHSVTGYDIVPRVTENIEVVSSIQDAVEGRDIVFIAVPTPHDPAYDGSTPSEQLSPKDFDYTIVKECIAEANTYMNKDQLLVLISTVLPGTTRREFVPLITNTKFAYNPYLIAMGSVSWDMTNPEMVMIGTEDGSMTGDAELLISFYKTIMENDPRYVIGTWDECECIKVFYNTFISAKISIANMIQDVAEKQGNINADIVTNALAESKMRITGPQYMRAGMGDGGGCHPRDNIALRFMADKLDLGYDLFNSIMGSREVQAKNLADRLIKEAEGRPIVIHGKAYKPGVPFLDGSYSLLVGYYCEELGNKPHYVDPLTGDHYLPETVSVFLLAHSANTTYQYTGKPQSDSLYCEIPDGSVVVDPWRRYVNPECTVIHYGNTRSKNF